MAQKNMKQGRWEHEAEGWETWWDSGHFFQQVFLRTGFGLAILTGGGAFLRTDDSFNRMLGYPEDGLVGTELASLLHPDDQHLLPVLYSWSVTGATVEPGIRQVRLIRADGVRCWFRATLSPVRMNNGNKLYCSLLLEDIRDLKEAEEAFSQKEHEYRSIVENSPDVIVRYNMEGKRIYVNPQFEQLTRLLSSEVVGHSFDDLGSMGQSFSSQYKQKLDYVLTNRVPVEFEIEGDGAEGASRYFQIKLVPEFGIDSQMSGVLAFARDITGIKKMQEQMELLSFAMDQSRDAIQLIDKNHRFVYVNNQYCHDLGYSKEELLSMGVSDVDRNASQKDLDSLQEALKQNRSLSLEFTHRGKNGEAVPYQVFASAFMYEGHFHVLCVCRNQSDIRKFQEQLELVYNALNRVDTAVFINDGEGRFIYVNQKACQLLGYSRDELLAMDIPAINTNMDWGFVEALYSNVTPGHSEFLKRQTSLIDKAGHVFTGEITKTLYNWQGKNFWVALIRDLSNQQQLDELLIRSEEDFMVFVEHSPDIIIRYDSSMRCVYVNQAWENIIGYPQFDMLDKTPTQNSYLPFEAMQGMEMILQQVIQSGQGIRQEFMLPHAVGAQPVHLLVDVVPERNKEGSVSGVLVVVRDITEIKKKEELLETKQAILEEAQRLGKCGSWEFDLVTNERDWSKETYRIFEMDPSEDHPSNEIFTELVHPDDRDKVNEIYNGLGKERENYEVELRLLFPDSRVKYIVEKGMTDFDSSGKPLRYLGTVQDVTDQKQYELKLYDALVRAEESSRLKSAFLAIISHEIRTPLNAIVGFTSLLQDDSLTPEERTEFMQLVEKSVDKLTGMLDDIIDLSKIESGSIKINPVKYDPVKMLHEKYMELKGLCRKAGKDCLKLRVEVEHVPENVEYLNDSVRIGQVLHILIENAVKFTKEGEITLGLSFTDNGKLTFSVSDTGIGIPTEKQESIFEPFVQVDGSTTRVYEGLGIGLSTARKLAWGMGGDLTVVSEPGNGSAFSLLLPAIYKEPNDKIVSLSPLYTK